MRHTQVKQEFEKIWKAIEELRGERLEPIKIPKGVVELKKPLPIVSYVGSKTPVKEPKVDKENKSKDSK